MDETITKITEKFEEVVNDIIAGNKQLAQLREIKYAIDLYRKSEDASKVTGGMEAFVINTIKETIFEKILTDFPNPSGFLEITFNQAVLKGNRNISLNVEVNLPSIKTFVDFEVSAGELVEKRFFTIGFKLDSKATLEEVRIFQTDGQNHVSVKRIVVSVSLCLLSQMIIGMKEVKIGEKDFLIKENLELRKTEKGTELLTN